MLAFLDVTSETLSDTGGVISGGGFGDPWRLTIEEADAGTVQIDLLSPDFDAYLALLGPAGHFLLDDDDSGGGPDGTSSQFNVSLAPGWYLVHVSSFSLRELGDYSLSIQP